LCWLHSVGQNHFYVTLLLSQGCCFIQSLHFSYKLQGDSVQNSNQSVQFPCIRLDDLSECSSVSRICLDNENFPSRCLLVSTSFELLKVASVSILVLFCVWTKSLMCNDAANRDSTFQSEVRRISKFPVSRPDNVSSRPDAHLSTVPSVRMTCHFVWTSDRQASSVRTMSFFRPDTYIVSRSFCANLIRPDVSAARPDAYQFSNGSLILSKFKKGKINQPSRRCGIPSERVSS
jgi:hypothetical protein